MDSKFCQEALNWILREIPGRVFLLTLTASPELKHALTRGGFSISERNFRKDATKRRILGTFNRRPDLAVSFLDKISTILRKDELVRNDVFKSPVDYKVMEEEWRTKLAETDEPRRVALSFYRDSLHPRLDRLGTLLLKYAPSFWNTGRLAGKPEDAPAAEVKAESAPTLHGEAALASKDQAPLADAIAQMSTEWVFDELSQSKTPKDDGAPSEAPRNDAPQAQEAPPRKYPTQEQVSLERVKAELKDARRRNGTLSQENSTLKKEMKTQRLVHEKELRAAREQVDTLRKQIDDVGKDFNAAIDELRDKFEAEQADQMASFYAKALGVHPDQLEFTSQLHDDNANLRARVDKMLARQRDVDKKYGTRQSLQNEARNLDQMLTRVTEAIENSLQLEPGMSDLEHELESRLEEVRKRLRDDVDEGENTLVGVLPRVVSYLKELPKGDASTLDALKEAESLLDTGLGRGIFSSGERKEILKVIEGRRHLVTRALEAARKASELKTLDELVPVAARMKKIYRIGNHLDVLKDVELFIDGYNVIKLDPEMSIREKAPGGFQATRSEFIERCGRVAKFFKKITLVFDGDLATDSVEPKNEHYTVVFTKKATVSQNADNWIVRSLAKAAEAPAGEEGDESLYWLVTNDNGLAARVEEICDGHVDVSTFTAWMGRMARSVK